MNGIYFIVRSPRLINLAPERRKFSNLFGFNLIFEIFESVGLNGKVNQRFVAVHKLNEIECKLFLNIIQSFFDETKRIYNVHHSVFIFAHLRSCCIWQRKPTVTAIFLCSAQRLVLFKIRSRLTIPITSVDKHCLTFHIAGKTRSDEIFLRFESIVVFARNVCRNCILI